MRDHLTDRHFQRIAADHRGQGRHQAAADQADHGRGPAAQARAGARAAGPCRLWRLPVRAGRARRRARPPDRLRHHQQDRLLPRAEPFRLPARRRRAGTAAPAARARPLLKVWSAACSTGAEAYTIAMVLARHARKAGARSDFAILGTDISTEVLATATPAIYPRDMVEPVPAAMRQRYLMRRATRRATRVRIVPELRRRVQLRAPQPDGRDLSVRPRRRRHLLPQRADLFRQADAGSGASTGSSRICGPAAT